MVTEGRRSPRHNDRIGIDGQDIGRVTSGSFSPSLKKGIALGYINKSYAAPGTTLDIIGPKATIKATITTLPFYKSGSARNK